MAKYADDYMAQKRARSQSASQPVSGVKDIPNSKVYTIEGRKVGVIAQNTDQQASAGEDMRTPGSTATSVTEKFSPVYREGKYGSTSTSEVSYKPVSTQLSVAKGPAGQDQQAGVRSPVFRKEEQKGRFTGIVPYRTTVNNGRLSIDPTGVTVVREEQPVSDKYDVVYAQGKRSVVYPAADVQNKTNLYSTSKIYGDNEINITSNQTEMRGSPTAFGPEDYGVGFGEVTATKRSFVSRGMSASENVFSPKLSSNVNDFDVRSEQLYSSKKEIFDAFPGGETVRFGSLASGVGQSFAFSSEFAKVRNVTVMSSAYTPASGILVALPPRETASAFLGVPRAVGTAFGGREVSFTERSKAAGEVGLLYATPFAINKAVGFAGNRLSPKPVKYDLSAQEASDLGFVGAGKKVTLRNIEKNVFVESERGRTFTGVYDGVTERFFRTDYEQVVGGMGGKFKVGRAERFSVAQSSKTYSLPESGRAVRVSNDVFYGPVGVGKGGEVMVFGTEVSKVRGEKPVVSRPLSQGYYGRVVGRYGKTTVSEGVRFETKQLGMEIGTNIGWQMQGNYATPVSSSVTKPVIGFRVKSVERVGYTRGVVVEDAGLRVVGYNEGRVSQTGFSDRFVKRLERPQVMASDPISASVLAFDRPSARNGFRYSDSLPISGKRGLGEIPIERGLGVSIPRSGLLFAGNVKARYSDSSISKNSVSASLVNIPRINTSLLPRSNSIVQPRVESSSRVSTKVRTSTMSRLSSQSRLTLETGGLTGRSGPSTPPPNRPDFFVGGLFPSSFNGGVGRRGKSRAGSRSYQYSQSFFVGVSKGFGLKLPKFRSLGGVKRFFWF